MPVRSRRAVELEPESKNAFHGAGRAASLALVYALVGEQEQAITLIERLLSTPGPVGAPGDATSSITLSELRLRWEWDSPPRQSAFPEDPRRPGAEDGLLSSWLLPTFRRLAQESDKLPRGRRRARAAVFRLRASASQLSPNRECCIDRFPGGC